MYHQLATAVAHVAGVSLIDQAFKRLAPFLCDLWICAAHRLRYMQCQPTYIGGFASRQHDRLSSCAASLQAEPGFFELIDRQFIPPDLSVKPIRHAVNSNGLRPSASLKEDLSLWPASLASIALPILDERPTVAYVADFFDSTYRFKNTYLSHWML